MLLLQPLYYYSVIKHQKRCTIFKNSKNFFTMTKGTALNPHGCRPSLPPPPGAAVPVAASILGPFYLHDLPPDGMETVRIALH